MTFPIIKEIFFFYNETMKYFRRGPVCREFECLKTSTFNIGLLQIATEYETYLKNPLKPSNFPERSTWLESMCGVLLASTASVPHKQVSKVSQTAPRETQLLEFCLWQSWFFFVSDSILTIKFCHTVVSTMHLIIIEDTIFCGINFQGGRGRGQSVQLKCGILVRFRERPC